MEDAWIGWAHLDGYDMLERLRGEGYKWHYVGHDIPDDLDVPGGYVLITDEFPEADVLVSKKFLDPRLAREHGIVAITPATRRGVTKKRIMDYYQGRTGPIVVTTPPAGEGKLVAVVHKATRRPGTWQGSKFDADGPYGHHEGDTEEAVLDELIEMGFTVPEAGGMKRILGRIGNPATFEWYCPSPPPELEEAALEETDYGIVDYIHDHAEEITPDEFAKAVGGWDVVVRDWYGGFSSESIEADAEFIRNDWSVSWYRSRYPDGTPIVFHTASGVEHVYKLPGWRERVSEALEKNPPYSGYDAIYFLRPMPDDITKISYQKKRDALNVFLDWNRAIVDDYGGEGQKHSPASFDAINHRFDIRGKRRVDTIAKAVWWALPSGSPYYLEDIDVELLNQTAPAIYNQRGLSFSLPDYAEEARLLEQQAEYWEERYGLPEDDDEVPF
jgi:hypothetical protein